MPIADIREVQSILSAFETRIRAVVDQSWVEFQDHMRIRRFMYARTRSDCFFDFLAQNAIAEFHADPDIRVLDKRTTVQFIFKEKVLLRFKKGNAKGVGSNITTQSVLDFIDPQHSLPGILSEVHRVEVCYQPNALGTELQEVAVVARNRTKRVWAYPQDGGLGMPDIMPFPIHSPDPDDEKPPAVFPKKPQPDVGKKE